MYTEVRGRSMRVQVALCSGDMTGIWLLPAFLVSSAMASSGLMPRDEGVCRNSQGHIGTHGAQARAQNVPSFVP